MGRSWLAASTGFLHNIPTTAVNWKCTKGILMIAWRIHCRSWRPHVVVEQRSLEKQVSDAPRGRSDENKPECVLMNRRPRCSSGWVVIKTELFVPCDGLKKFSRYWTRRSWSMVENVVSHGLWLERNFPNLNWKTNRKTREKRPSKERARSLQVAIQVYL